MAPLQDDSFRGGVANRAIGDRFQQSRSPKRFRRQGSLCASLVVLTQIKKHPSRSAMIEVEGVSARWGYPRAIQVAATDAATGSEPSCLERPSSLPRQRLR